MSYIKRGYTGRNYRNYRKRRNKISIRGRPRRNLSGKAWSVIDTLARMVMRQNIDPDNFFNTLADAWKHGESTFEKLVIERRKKTTGSATFLFLIDNKVIGQFPIPESILKENNPIKNYIDNLPPEVLNKTNRKENLKIEDLKPKMKRVKLKARIIETPKPKTVYTRFGTMASVSNFIVADETGTIKLSLWNHQINKASEDDVIAIKNAKVAWFRGELQLRLGRNGEFTVVEEEEFPSIDKLKEPNEEFLI
jgi:replication factor A1